MERSSRACPAALIGGRLGPEDVWCRSTIGLLGFQAFDCLANALPNPWIDEQLRRLQIPRRYWIAFPVIKGLSVAGIGFGLRHPTLGRVTSTALKGYFVVALAAHWRVKDESWRYVPAVIMLAWSVSAGRHFARSATTTPVVS